MRSFTEATCVNFPISAVCNFKQNYVASESKIPPFPLPPSPLTPSEGVLDNFVAHGVIPHSPFPIHKFFIFMK